MAIGLTSGRSTSSRSGSIGLSAPTQRKASIGLTSGSNPVSSITGVKSNPRGTAAFLNRAAAANVGPGPAFSPIGAVLRAASVPGFAVGRAILHPSTLVSDITHPQLFGPGSAVGLYHSKDSVLPGTALKQRGLMPGGLLGQAAEVAGNVFLDPTTYLGFGAGAAAREAGRAASGELLNEARLAAASGTRVPLGRVAEIHAAHQIELASAPKSLGVYFRVPFTRGQELRLGEIPSLGAFGSHLASAIGNTRAGEALREVFLPAGSGSKAVHAVGAATRRAGDAEKAAISSEAQAFQKELVATAKDAGIKPQQAMEMLTHHLDNPGHWSIPTVLQPLRDKAATFFDHLRGIEDQSGIVRGNVPDYVPHIPATGAVRRKMEKILGPANVNRDFFFQKDRALPNLDAWLALGLQPEHNLARLMEIRGHASVDSRVLKAFDQHVGQFATEGDIARTKDMLRPSLTGHSGVIDAKRFVNAIGASWKSLALQSPGYHLRNLQSDALGSYWSGARNPRSFVQAARILGGGGKSVKIAGETLNPAELTALAEAAGVVKLGQSGREITGELNALGSGVRRFGRLARPGRGRWAQASQAVGNRREDIVRLGTFIEHLKAGRHVLESAKKTHNFLFDYGDTGRFVKSARKFALPFITYPSKAVPMIGRVAATHPGTLANVGAVTGGLNQAAGNPDLSLLPIGSRSAFAVPAPGVVKRLLGAPGNSPLLFNPESVLPYGTLNQVDPTNPGRAVGGYLNPAIGSAIEAKTGYSFFYDRGGQPNRVKAPAMIALAHRLGIPIPNFGPKHVSYPAGSADAPGYSRNLDLFFRLLPLYGQSAGLVPGGGTDTNRMPYLRYFGGVSVQPWDQAKAAYYANKYGRRP